jgi:hypothetical protein
VTHVVAIPLDLSVHVSLMAESTNTAPEQLPNIWMNGWLPLCHALGPTSF